jgi:LPXTG-motif cell wall-anchored protein
LFAVLAVPGVTLAGGVSVDPDKPLPEPVVNRPFTLGFMIHSLHDNQPPITGLQPIVRLNNPATGEQVQVTAQPQGAAGHYAAGLTLRSTGDWRLQFQPYGTEVQDYLVTMPNLHVRSPGEAAAPSQAAPNPSKDVDAKAGDSYFEPLNMTVTAGSTVTWTNVGRIPHTVTADDGSFVSGNLKPDASFSFTFAKPGTYHYYCEYHGRKLQAMGSALQPVSFMRSPVNGGGAHMEGTVTVVADAKEASAAHGAQAAPNVLAQAAPNVLAQTAPDGRTTAKPHQAGAASSQALPATGSTSVPFAVVVILALLIGVLGLAFRRRRVSSHG